MIQRSRISCLVTRTFLFAFIAAVANGTLSGQPAEAAPQRSGGTVEKGFLEIQLNRGNAVPFELTVLKTPGNCQNCMNLRIKWDAEKNLVEASLQGRGVLEAFPSVNRTLGENYYPNSFLPEPEDYDDGRYQIWLVSAAGPLTEFYYDPQTLDLLGSEYDFEQPAGIPISFPTLYLIPSPFFQPDENGDVDLYWTFPYDRAVRGDRPDLSHFIVTFPPHNLAQANPYRLDQSTLRPYVTRTFPAADARSWSDYLRGGLLFDVTVEPPEYFMEPPAVTLVGTYSGASAVAGGVPQNWVMDIDAAFMNVAPPIKHFPSNLTCEEFYEFHGTPPEITEEMIALAAEFSLDPHEPRPFARGLHPPKKRTLHNDGVNHHFEDTVRFHPIQPGADAVVGQALFGLSDDGVTEDPAMALFEGASVPFGGNVTSNGRTCFTCHRGPNHGFGLPAPPLRDHIDATDTLFTGIDADADGDPDGMVNLDDRGLFKIRPNRFDPRFPTDDPFRQVFGWRKSPKLTNIGLSQGFLTDLRGRVMFETARGAVFSHTQNSDGRFDDLFPLEAGNDLEAFLFGIFSDPTLAALRANNPGSGLLTDPYATVPIETPSQRRGKDVFHRNCFVCHNTPQVFNNLANVEPLGNGERPPDFPSWAPAVGRAFNIGVSERNRHGLRFTQHIGAGSFEPIVLPLADEDGAVNLHEVRTDIGLAATTARSVDIGRFKVPQLRNLANNGPYFHDNSAATIKEVVRYFNSPSYNQSKDGRRYPIHLNERQMKDLVEFLKVL